jgi:hypothetical protein
MFKQMLRRLHLRLRTLAWASSALPGEDMWRRASGDGAHCPCAARHAALNDHIVDAR